MVGLSVKNRKLAQGVSEYTVLDMGDSTRIVIRGLGFYDDF